jgi:hypothetical protein
MNREQAKALMPVIQAFVEGSDIEYRCKDNNTPRKWTPTAFPTFHSDYEYRIKPKMVKPVPYKRFVAEHQGMKYVALKYNHEHPDFRLLEDRPWYGVFVAWIDTEWQTHEIPSPT